MIETRQTPIRTIPEEVQAFAAEQDVSAYLPAVLEMTQRLFSAAHRITSRIEDDPEIPNDRHLVIGIQVASMDVEQYVEAKFQWGRELFKLCPAPLVCNFRCALGFDEP